jgi:hypothetical protein
VDWALGAADIAAAGTALADTALADTADTVLMLEDIDSEDTADIVLEAGIDSEDIAAEEPGLAVDTDSEVDIELAGDTAAEELDSGPVQKD